MQITKSVWDVPDYCSPRLSYGYCGLGLRLARELFQDAKVLPANVECGSKPMYVSFKGKGAQVSFEQNATTANALFVSTYEGKPPYGPGPGFAFMCLVLIPCDLKQGHSLEGAYVITVSDV